MKTADDYDPHSISHAEMDYEPPRSKRLRYHWEDEADDQEADDAAQTQWEKEREI